MYKKKNIKMLIETINEKNPDICLYLIQFKDHEKYGIVNIFQNGKVIAVGNIDYLVGFLEGLKKGDFSPSHRI